MSQVLIILVFILRSHYLPWIYFLEIIIYFNHHHSVIHLTNVAIQKMAPDYDPEKGCKWSIRQLRQYMTAKHGYEGVSWPVESC